MRKTLLALIAALTALVLALIPVASPRVRVTRRERPAVAAIAGARGAPARYSVDTFSAAAPADQALAALVGDVVRQDLEFEGAFDILPAGSALSADGRVRGSAGQAGGSLEVEVRIVNAATGDEVFARGYSGPPADARFLAHVAADEILLAQAGIQGVARTRLAFVSDRAGLRRELGGAMRRIKEIWVADYDGANERRVTWDGDLDMNPSWSPDGREVAYTSFRRGFQDVFVAAVSERRVDSPTRGFGRNWLPAWSPDGRQMAFTSSRDGNAEIYLVNRDGTDLRRITQHPAIDTSPAWSPNAAQIAFTSNRGGSPQIWVMAADGSNPRAVTDERYCDRPTWSPPPYNEIAYVSNTPTGFDIKVVDLATGETRPITVGEGFDESPAFAPNGRHIAFSSTRRGGQQIWIASRDGRRLRQVTTVGNNTMPAWGR